MDIDNKIKRREQKTKKSTFIRPILAAISDAANDALT